MHSIEQYHVFEKVVPPDTKAVFSWQDEREEVRSFDDGERHFIRFMPTKTGIWEYSLQSVVETEQGCFVCEKARAENHGPVQVCGMGFAYADGTPYQPFGITCYAWTHQAETLRQQTLQTLAASPFNKVRMCVFPKHMAYCKEEPGLFPFARKNDGTWDCSLPDARFWRDLESQIAALDKLRIEADLILFHPYDRWGFASLSREDSLLYLDYCVRRLGAYKNIWWSLANEYDLLLGKTEADWEAFADRLLQDDAKHHLRSIHNCCQPYPRRDWMTHVSLQTNRPREALALRHQYQMPVVVDEMGYEGNLEFTWGNLTGREAIHRAWTAVCSGGWPTHGETLLEDQKALWWAKGGALNGEAPKRIAFLKALLSELPGIPEPLIQPLRYDVNGAQLNAEAAPFVQAMSRMSEADRTHYLLDITPVALIGPGWQLYYYGRGQSQWADVHLPEDETWAAERIDTWNMRRIPTGQHLRGAVRVELGGHEGMALLLKKEENQHENG